MGITATRQHGFTLLELVVVLLIVVLGFAAIGLNLAPGREAAELQAAARDVVSALNYTRGQAIVRHRDEAVTLNLSDNSYTVSGRDRLYRIPATIDLTVVTAQTEVAEHGVARLRFFADGSSTGGRITLQRGNAVWKIDINWLTGQVELRHG